MHAYNFEKHKMGKQFRLSDQSNMVESNQTLPWTISTKGLHKGASFDILTS